MRYVFICHLIRLSIGAVMGIRIFSCLLVSSLLLSGCSQEIDSPDPATFYTNIVKNRLKIKPEDLVKYYSTQSLQDEDVSPDKFASNLQKDIDDLKFKGFTIEDVKVNDVNKYNESTVILHATIKFKTSDKVEDQFANDTVVLIKETNTWRMSFDNLIKRYRYADSCGVSGSIKLCISDAYIFPDKTMFIANVNNSSNVKYTFGFASPASTLIVLEDKSEVYGNFPSVHSGQSHSSATVLSGDNQIIFYFGTAMDPELVKAKPIYFAVNQLKKLGWGDMPSLSDKGKQIDINLNESGGSL